MVCMYKDFKVELRLYCKWIMGRAKVVIINWFSVFLIRVNYMSANNNENIFTWIFDLVLIDPFIKQKQHEEKLEHDLTRAIC